MNRELPYRPGLLQPGLRRRASEAAKAAAAIADLVYRRRGLVVLIYHRVGGRTSLSVDLPQRLFTEQIVTLAAKHAVVTLDVAADLLGSSAAPSGPAPICVTFDDGTADFLDLALPLLVEHAVPVTLYLTTFNVESGKPFPDGAPPVSWSGLRDALKTGLVTMGSHTHTHRLLDRVDRRVASYEIERSVSLIEDRLGVECRHFAYPKALAGTSEAEEEVRRRFRTAALARTRPNQYGQADLHRLNRSPVQVGDGMRWFRQKAGGGLGLEDDMRSLLNRRRYAGETS